MIMLSERAEEILEILWLETVENRKTPDLSLFRDDTAFKELLDQATLRPVPAAG
jgi:hypothetical protein